MQNTLQEHIQDNFLSEAQSQHAPLHSNLTRDKQQHIRVEKIKLLYQHSLTPIILSAVAGLFLVAALWKSANHQHLLIWLATTFIFACVRIWLMTQFKHTNPQVAPYLNGKSLMRLA
jgi:hypothetical protein